MAVPRTIVEGKLTPSALSGLLKKLEGNRGAAYLLVSDGLSEKCLYFSVGAIRLSSMGRRRARTLEQIVSAHPRVDPSVLERARQREREMGEALEDALGNMDYGDVIRECSTAIVRDEVLDLIVWEGAYYEYCETNPPPKIFDPRLDALKLSFGVNKLLKEAEEGVQRVQKAAPKIGAGRVRLVKGSQAVYGAPNGVDAKLGEAVLETIGDQPTFVDDVYLGCRKLGFDVIQTAAALEAMLDARVVDSAKGQSVRLSPEEEKEQAKREADEIEAALELLIDEFVARQRLAAKYQALGDDRKAVHNLKKVGEELAVRNRAEEAIDVFRQVLKVVPTDFPARERIVQLFERLKRLPEAVGEGLVLAREYGKFGLVNRAKNVFRHLIALNPMQIDIRRELIELLVRMREKPEAVVECEQLADIFKEQQDEAQLLAVYQQILALDPNHAGAIARTRSVARRSWAFVLPYAAVAAGFLILIAASLYVASEYSVLSDYKEARKLAFDRADRDDFQGARSAVDDFVSRHEWQKHRVEALRKELAELEVERRGRAAAEEYGRARTLESGKRVSEAYAIYRTLVSTGRGTEWEGKAAERIRAIDVEIEEAERLATGVKRLYQDKKDRDAYDRARELIRRYGWSAAATSTDIPLEIQTVPPGATITLNSKEKTTRTPAVVPMRLGLPYTLQLSMPGFQTEVKTVDLHEEIPFPYRVEMKKQLRWKATTAGPIESAPSVTDAGVFFGGRDQRVYALGPDGSARWSRSLGMFAETIGRTLRAGARVVVGDKTGQVTGLDSTSGDVQWRTKLSGPASGVAVAPGVAVVADQSGALIGLDAEKGKERWRLKLPGALAAPVATADGDALLLAATEESILVAADPVTGRELGRMSTGARAVVPPAVAGAGYLVATEDALLKLLAREGGREIWRVKLPAMATAAPLTSATTVFVPAGDILIALDLRDGSERWRQQFRAPIRATPAHRSGRLYIGAADGTVYALAAETGALRWMYRTGGEILAQPLANADTVYVASTDFTLYAIAD